MSVLSDDVKREQRLFSQDRDDKFSPGSCDSHPQVSGKGGVTTDGGQTQRNKRVLFSLLNSIKKGTEKKTTTTI